MANGKWKIRREVKSELNFPLKVMGKHNQLNAAAAMQVGLSLGIDPTSIRTSLMQFSGTQRRMEYLGEFKGALIYSDFAHHPTEIRVTTEALKHKYSDRNIYVLLLH